jgi:hypothetical protein
LVAFFLRGESSSALTTQYCFVCVRVWCAVVSGAVRYSTPTSTAHYSMTGLVNNMRAIRQCRRRHDHAR